MVTPTWKRRETKTMSESAGSDSEFERYMQDVSHLLVYSVSNIHKLPFI